MKNITKILNLAAIMLFLIGSSSSCEKEKFTTLPPETQTGANTFGCYINGELFVAQRGYGPFGGTYLSAGYSRNNKQLGIAAYGKNGDTGFSLFDPKEKIKISVSTAGYRKQDNLYGLNPIGEIYLTKFDTINNIVSGTFFYKIKKYNIKNDYNDTVANITEGRFDIKLEISQ